MDRVMNRTARRRLAALGLGVTLGVMTASTGLAQLPATGPGVSSIGKRTATQGARRNRLKRHRKPFRGQGPRSGRSRDKRRPDMQPTDALFDAINRATSLPRGMR